MKISDEQDAILNDLEKHNTELTKAFEKYRLIRIQNCQIDHDDKSISDDFYSKFNLAGALEDIRKCADKVKNDSEKLELIFKKDAECLKKLLKGRNGGR